MKKFVAVAICAGMLFNSGVYITPVTADTDLKVSLDGLAEAMDASKPHGVSITIE